MLVIILPKPRSILIKHGILISMDPNRRIIEDAAVAIEGDKILDTGKTEELVKKHPKLKLIT